MPVSKEDFVHTFKVLAPRGAVLLLLAGLAATSAFSQPAQTMEERLRSQLQATTQQLQQAQNELAVLKAGQPAAGKSAGAAASASPDVDTLKKELAESRGQLAAERQARARQGDSVQQQAQLTEKANAQVLQFRNAYEELLKMARASEAERQRLGGTAAQQKTALAQCEAKNGQLYAVGQEILRAYETLDMNTLMSARQPFAAQSRVKYEQIAQDYGDKLYEGRFDARSVAAPAAAAAPAAEAKPAATPAK